MSEHNTSPLPDEEYAVIADLVTNDILSHKDRPYYKLSDEYLAFLEGIEQDAYTVVSVDRCNDVSLLAVSREGDVLYSWQVFDHKGTISWTDLFPHLDSDPYYKLSDDQITNLIKMIKTAREVMKL